MIGTKPRPEGEVSRLAKWAQRYIHSLVRRIEELEGTVAALSDKHPNSNVVLAGRTHLDPDAGLPPDSTVYFYAGEVNDRLTNMIEVRHDHDNPDRIYLSSYGSRSLLLRMSSSNSLYLELDKRLWALALGSSPASSPTSPGGW